MVKLLIVPACAFVCSFAMVCPAAFDLASIINSGCFAAIALPYGGCFAAVVIGRLLGRCFAIECVVAPCRCFAIGGVFLADALTPWTLGSLADALPPLRLFALFLGGCFATTA
jgi:hypothetical protein